MSVVYQGENPRLGSVIALKVLAPELATDDAFRARHPRTYLVEQMSAGMVSDAQAAGRVFCNFNDTEENFVWTQDDGHLLGYVVGPVHEDVWHGGSVSTTTSASPARA
jgi:hypothetical protein